MHVMDDCLLFNIPELPGTARSAREQPMLARCINTKMTSRMESGTDANDTVDTLHDLVALFDLCMSS